MKSKKWYKRLIFHLIDLCCVNAWTLQNHFVGLTKFKLEVARCLVEVTSNPKPLERTEIQKDSCRAKYVPNAVRLDGVGHLPTREAESPKKCKFVVAVPNSFA